MANLVMDGAKKSKGSLAGFHDFGTLWEGGRYLHQTLQIDPWEVLGLVKQEAKDDFALMFCTLVSHSPSMVYPTICVLQCYDLERAVAELPVDASWLKVVGHSSAAVASLPRRLANLPPRQSRLEYATARKVEGWTVTCVCNSTGVMMSSQGDTVRL
jgi:hypothetical protein